MLLDEPLEGAAAGLGTASVPVSVALANLLFFPSPVRELPRPVAAGQKKSPVIRKATSGEFGVKVGSW